MEGKVAAEECIKLSKVISRGCVRIGEVKSLTH